MVLLVFTQTALACCAYVSMDELIERSDVILVGEVINKSFLPIKTGKTYNYIKWKVKVNYYLKGELTEEEIYVATPDDYTSAHYKLTLWGNRAILFLKKQDNYYITHTPQAIVGVEFLEDMGAYPEIREGKDLLKFIRIKGEGIEFNEKVKLEEYISSLGLIKKPNRRERLVYPIILLVLTIILGLWAFS